MMSLFLHLVATTAGDKDIAGRWVGACERHQEIRTPEELEMTIFPIPAGLFPVEHRFMDLGRARIHYVDEGAGSTLLL